ncbi:PilZ domain-containing protein [Stakelama saccharophila]|uniref:PilZ domain-containing protein n=1 Tax=Stakelama saccharophila TaxID=3075605 RepID=A0ABZ0B6H5_9SPHN|nr:PilZ domain-containing protein [Stakelama sp. W311]WNO52600.1 PilZ domain-containing protein [Stakelama sp. W311]
MVDQRAVDRDEVHYRARGFGPDAREHLLLVVNISPHGLMARIDADYEPGQRMRVTLPVVGVTTAEIRWSLGGRMGFHFDTAIDLASYYEMLTRMIEKR